MENNSVGLQIPRRSAVAIKIPGTKRQLPTTRPETRVPRKHNQPKDNSPKDRIFIVLNFIWVNYFPCGSRIYKLEKEIVWK